jgi:hypothetical protein
MMHKMKFVLDKEAVIGTINYNYILQKALMEFAQDKIFAFLANYPLNFTKQLILMEPFWHQSNIFLQKF